jgi:hypothetical protein
MDSLGFVSLPQNWNNGMMEYWTVGFFRCSFNKNRITLHIKQNSQSFNTHISRTHYPIIPIFQHSNSERSELSS